MTVFFDPTNRQMLKPEGGTASVPRIVAEAAIRTNDVDIVHAWALATRQISRNDEIVMVGKAASSASLPAFA